MWRIDRDYISREGETTRVGVTGGEAEKGDRFRFRLLDDDGEVYYGGWFNNADFDTDALEGALTFALHDAGCTSLEVRADQLQQLGVRDPALTIYERYTRDGWTSIYA